MTASGAGGPEGSAPRWWRRSRDLALRAAREAQADAQQAMVHLESLEVDLVELSAIDAAAAAHRAGLPVTGFTTPLSQDWDRLSVQTGIPALRFYELDAAFDPGVDHEEDVARRFATDLAEVAARLRDQLPQVEQFRARHASALAAAAALRDEVPGLIATVEDLQRTSGRGLADAGSGGLADPAALAAHNRATTLLGQARQSAADRRWAEAHVRATEAREAAENAAERVQDLGGDATRVRNGLLSVRTRRAALATQQGRLPDVMSRLRRGYTLSAWRHVEKADQIVARDLREVDEGLPRLEALLAQRPLDVPAASAVLADVRTSLGEAEQVLRTAIDLLERLDRVSADPGTLLGELRRRLVDARRFVAGLPGNNGARYAFTLDNLAGRTDALASATTGIRPDWGGVLTEAASIEAAIDAMIRTARGH
ncbi:hypothetical protein ACFQ0K_00115 [Nocardioides caeni]|uniref:Uncharacterized protein n=1 Tax=Nocardioides caeni TaxID=574700 RepID=A0A4S8NP46_9ACTN|nr:hypothetical protein [Nocardioides caeni]THV18703.1 hypothetical protein E9934_03630 [Nocardioides caeni]